MDRRAAELHASALSPPEYKAFGTYLQALTGRSSVTPSSIKGDTTFTRVQIRQVAQDKLGVDQDLSYSVIQTLLPGRGGDLTVGQTLACFRLMGHAKTAANRNTGPGSVKVDLALLFVPCTPPDINKPARVPPPVPSRSRKTSANLTTSSKSEKDETVEHEVTTRGSSSRQSLPARFPSNPFHGNAQRPSPEKKGRVKSVTFDNDHTEDVPGPTKVIEDLTYSSSNPFRQRHVSVPTIVAHPPPIPPRTSSNAADSPRRSKRVSSVSSATSLISHNTSGPRASTLIQSSLTAAAAQSASSRKLEPSIHVIRQSTGGSASGPAPVEHTRPSSSSRNAELIRRVSEAVKESEEETPLTPPRRAASLSTKSKSKSKMRQLAKSFLAQDPDLVAWTCVDLIQGLAGEREYAMVILNQPITRKDIFLRAWSASTLRLCADGGANRLYDSFNSEQRQSYLPTLIKGDLDSLRTDVREYYASKGVSILHDGSEYSTDLQKCIEEIESAEKENSVEYDLLLIGGLSGRVDQTVHVMSLLHKLRKTRPRSFILSSESLAWVLDEGSHIIEIDHSTMGQTCGILPVGVSSAYVKTDGLKWNLDWETSFDGDVSSSNHLLPSEPLVHLKTSRPILWCIEIKPNLPTLPKSASHGQKPVKRSTSTSTSTSNASEISKGIRELSVGMAKAAEGVGRELEKLAARDSQSVDSKPKKGGNLAEGGSKIPPSLSTDRLREEAGWSRLD